MYYDVDSISNPARVLDDVLTVIFSRVEDEEYWYDLAGRSNSPYSSYHAFRSGRLESVRSLRDAVVDILNRGDVDVLPF